MDEGIARIELRRKSGPSLWAVVDEADRELVGQYRWTAAESGSTYYAIRTCGNTTVYMHRLILQPPVGLEVDHADRNGLNNRRSNLRVATRAENRRNRPGLNMRAGRPTTSRFKGVSWHAKTKAWEAGIQVDGRREYLGLHASQEAAAWSYDRRAREAFGEFACLNFPDEVAS